MYLHKTNTVSYSFCLKTVGLLVSVGLFFGNAFAKSSHQMFDVKVKFDMEDLTYEAPDCTNRWKREDVLNWLRSHHSWIPEAGLLPGDTPQERHDARQELIDTFQRPGDPFIFGGAPIHGEAKALPLQWLDIDGDGMCDFVGSYADLSMHGANQIIYIFLQGNGGFKLVDYSLGEYEHSGTGIAGGDFVIPVWVKGSKIPFLTQHYEFSLSRQKGTISRWNNKEKIFNNFYRFHSPPINQTNNEAKAASIVKTIEEFQERHPPKYNKALSCENFYENVLMCSNPW